MLYWTRRCGGLNPSEVAISCIFVAYQKPYPVKPSCKKYPNFASIFLARLARSCTKSCKSCTKNEAFLARYKLSCKKKCEIIFLQDLIEVLQENCLAIFSCKIFISCKKSFIFSARLTRFSARSCKSCKKNTCKICVFPARRLLLGRAGWYAGKYHYSRYIFSNNSRTFFEIPDIVWISIKFLCILEVARKL